MLEMIKRKPPELYISYPYTTWGSLSVTCLLPYCSCDTVVNQLVFKRPVSYSDAFMYLLLANKWLTFPFNLNVAQFHSSSFF